MARGRSSLRRKTGKDPRVGVARYRDILLRDGALPSSSDTSAQLIESTVQAGDMDNVYGVYENPLYPSLSDDISPFSSGRTSFSLEGEGYGGGDSSIGIGADFDMVSVPKTIAMGMGLTNGTGQGTGKKGIGNMTMSSQKPKIPPRSPERSLNNNNKPSPSLQPPLPSVPHGNGEGEGDEGEGEEGRYSSYSTQSWDGSSPFLSDQLSKEYRERFLQRIDLQRLGVGIAGGGGGREGGMGGIAGRSGSSSVNLNGSSESLVGRSKGVRFAA